MKSSASHSERPVALVTGGSKGIGFAVSQALAKRGYALVLVARTPADLDTAAIDLRARFSVPVTTLTLDLALPGSYLVIHEYIASNYGKLDVLVNNVGDFKLLPSAGEHGPRTEPNEFAVDIISMFAVNALPAAALALTMRNLQLRALHPKQLDILSSAALEIFPGNIPYGLTKVAHERLSLSVPAETRGYIKTYRVYPSNTDTRIVSQFIAVKLDPLYVGEAAVAMLQNDSATDLYLKLTASGLIEARGKLDYVQYLRADGLQYDGLALVRAHRELLERELMPAAERAK